MAPKRRAGARERNGRIQRGNDYNSIAKWQRILSSGDKLAVDPVLETSLGRLCFVREITPVEAAAGCRLAEVVGRFERLVVSKRRTAASPSYEVGRGGDGNEITCETSIDLPEDQRTDCKCPFCVRNRAATKAYDKVIDLLELAPREVRRAVEDVCIGNQACPPGMLLDLKEMLGILATHFGLTLRRAAEERKQKTNLGAAAAAKFAKRNKRDDDESGEPRASEKSAGAKAVERERKAYIMSITAWNGSADIAARAYENFVAYRARLKIDHEREIRDASPPTT